MVYYLDQFPETIISKINDYTPRDKDMKSPTSSHIKSLLYYYNYDYDELYELIDEWENQDRDFENPFDEYHVELFFKPHDNETFYEYALRIYKKEKLFGEEEKYYFPRYI